MKRSETRRFEAGSDVAVSEVGFTTIKHAIAKQFELMKAHGLYRIDLSLQSDESMDQGMRIAFTKDKLWETYLAAFPAGTNPIFKERTEHDCQCCKSFVRTMGSVVSIIDGRLVSIWDVQPTGDDTYDHVCVEMTKLVESGAIANLFLHTEKSVGTEKSFAQVVGEDGAVEARVWEHFHVHLPASVVMKGDLIGPKLSDARATHDVFQRGLNELTLDSVDTVLELIAQDSLYRGSEYKGVLQQFRALKVEFECIDVDGDSPHPDEACRSEGTVRRLRDNFIWSQVHGATNPATLRIRNTAIGTLLIDLSAGVELEDAVKKFETSIMAPGNYKRPTALVSKAMIEKAKRQVGALGLTSALERRYAHIDDITVNNILFADRSLKRLTKKDAFESLAAAAVSGISKKSLDKVEEVSIADFLKNVLPKATTLEVMMENRHAGNLVSLVAPVDPGAKHLFKWPNGFSWSYAGDVTDSIKERVKAAGGSVVGDLCCRLAWDYTDDLDFHMLEPGVRGGVGAYEIYFANRRVKSPNGGVLDVDANGADGMVPNPVENIFYANKAGMREGVYELSVHNYSRRWDGVGFEVEVEFGGETLNLAYDKAVRQSQKIVVAQIEYSKATGFKVTSELTASSSSKRVWGVATQAFHKVNVVMLSPNYWDTTGDDLDVGYRGYQGIGNRHFFFMLDACRNEGTARGFYNEFLSQELEPHRKVMEMVGAKMKTDEAERQLSGLGFSSTQRNSLLVRVGGTFSRVVKVVF